jgi:hypothetical protein
VIRPRGEGEKEEEEKEGEVEKTGYRLHLMSIEEGVLVEQELEIVNKYDVIEGSCMEPLLMFYLGTLSLVTHKERVTQ